MLTMNKFIATIAIVLSGLKLTWPRRFRLDSTYIGLTCSYCGMAAAKCLKCCNLGPVGGLQHGQRKERGHKPHAARAAAPEYLTNLDTTYRLTIGTLTNSKSKTMPAPINPYMTYLSSILDELPFLCPKLMRNPIEGPLKQTLI